jgi:hypothetical protein
MERGVGSREIAHNPRFEERVVFEYSRTATHLHPEPAKEATLEKNKKGRRTSSGQSAL